MPLISCALNADGGRYADIRMHSLGKAGIWGQMSAVGQMSCIHPGIIAFKPSCHVIAAAAVTVHSSPPY